MPSSGLEDAFKNVLAGSIGGILQCLPGHPFDTVKVRLQTSTKYSGMVDCFRVIIKEEGFFGMYKGVQSPLIGLSVMNAYLFFINGLVKKFLQRGNPSKELTIAEIAQGGAITGALLGFMETPVDFFKCQLQVRYSSYNGYFDCISKVIKTYGITGAFQGLSATMLRNVPANLTYFAVYEYVKRFLSKKYNRNASLSDILIAGWFAGTLYWLPSYPADVIKSAMQTDSPNKEERINKTIIQTSKIINQKFGIKGFFKGFTPAIVRGGAANALCFVGFEYTRKLLDSSHK